MTITRKRTDGYVNEFEQKFGKPFEEFITVQNATETLSSGTKDNYRKNLPEFFLWLGENPDQVIANRKIQVKADDETSDHYERKVRAYKKYLEDKNQTGRSIAGKIGRIQGFFKNNSSRYKLNLGIMKYSKKRKTEKYSPDNAMCREIYSFCDSARDRLIFALAFQNGIVPIDIAENDYSNFPAEPFKYYKGCREKNKEIWHGVTTPEIVQEFLAYKKIRGEPASGEPFFKGREGFLDSAGISQILSKVIKKAGYGNIAGFSPKSLRDGFEDALVDAEIPGKVKEAMMGHVGDIEHQYGGQNRLALRMEEYMQKAYRNLQLTKNDNTNGTTKQQFDILQAENTQIKAQLEKQTQDFLNFKQEVFAVIQSIKQDFNKVDPNEKETETLPTESTNTP
ncbi:MAG: site-specific integrase [Nitrososphaerota archaeon]|jgi:site-specific recombinase XerD|nr:site-specific integrase [Nitrososphaerota archaeon]